MTKYTPNVEIDTTKTFTYTTNDMFELRNIVDRIRDIAHDINDDKAYDIYDLCDDLMEELYDPELHAKVETMGDLKCNRCGNTTHFHRLAYAESSFKSIREMENKPVEFTDWNGDITCSDCYESDVKEIL